MTKRFTDEQIVGILRPAEADGLVIRDLCRKHNIRELTFFHWHNRCGGDLTVFFGPT
jgi:putative transposase